MSDLHESASTGDLEALEEGLKRGLDPSEPDPEWGGKTPLHIASARGHKKCVFVLIRAGSEVNARTDTGWTPAHSACETGQVRGLVALHHAQLHHFVSISLDNGMYTPFVWMIYD